MPLPEESSPPELPEAPDRLPRSHNAAEIGRAIGHATLSLVYTGGAVLVGWAGIEQEPATTGRLIAGVVGASR